MPGVPLMVLHTIKSIITFAALVKLEGWEATQPAGRYDIETDDELSKVTDERSIGAWRPC